MADYKHASYFLLDIPHVLQLLTVLLLLINVFAYDKMTFPISNQQI